tara:strand:+ start:1116 stop:1400 length:285 start_codon:yes stop_codon:yes gene_type:complete
MKLKAPFTFFKKSVTDVDRKKLFVGLGSSNYFTFIDCLYKVNLHNESEYEASGHVIATDEPIDYEWRGENFSPTDLLATKLDSYFLTIMGITAK